MSGEESESSSRSKSSFDTRIFEEQIPYLTEMYGSASDLYGDSSRQMQDMAPGMANTIQQNVDQSNPYWQSQMEGGAYQDMNLQNQLMGSLNQSLNNPSAMQDINSMIMGGDGNNYADAMKNQYVDDANRATDNMMSNLDARAAASGMSGGSRHGVATARGMDDINRNLQRNMAETGYNTFDKDLDRKLQIAQQADQGTLARQDMMQGMIGDMQNTQNLGLNNTTQMNTNEMDAMAPYMAPWQAMGQYAGAIGSPQVLGSGESKTSSDSKSGGGGIGG